MSHHCVDWIPAELAGQVSLFWTLDFGVPEYDLPKIWIEHGIPDTHVISREQFHDDIHYLCSNSWTYNELKGRGLKAYHVGSIFLDKTIPDRYNRRLFVYAPQHTRMEEYGANPEWNHDPLTVSEIEALAKEYHCEDYVTSLVDDTDRELYKDLKPMISDRYLGMGMAHFKKCKYLYENANIIYTDIMSTFDIVAEAHGIPVIGRDKQKMPRQHENVGVLVDGMSCTRILFTIKKIVEGGFDGDT